VRREGEDDALTRSKRPGLQNMPALLCDPGRTDPTNRRVPLYGRPP
jgi:hypothetical protein